MNDYDDSDGGQAFSEYEEWCEAQDAANHAAYWPTPAEMGLCYSGLHDCDAGCCCSEHYADQDVPF